MKKYKNRGQDHTARWKVLLQGDENDFPTEATRVNQKFEWLHMFNGRLRNHFDCTDPNSYRIIPPKDYLKAYRTAKKLGTINSDKP